MSPLDYDVFVSYFERSGDANVISKFFLEVVNCMLLSLMGGQSQGSCLFDNLTQYLVVLT